MSGFEENQLSALKKSRLAGPRIQLGALDAQTQVSLVALRKVLGFRVRCFSRWSSLIRALKCTIELRYHYVEVARDFSDLPEKIEWCRAHDEECRQIAENGKEFMKQFADPNTEALLEKLVVTFCERNVVEPENGPLITKYPADPSWSRLHYAFKTMLTRQDATHVGTVVLPDPLTDVTIKGDEWTFRNSDFSKEIIRHLLGSARGSVVEVLKDVFSVNRTIRDTVTFV
jgi:hypothetical protein